MTAGLWNRTWHAPLQEVLDPERLPGPEFRTMFFFFSNRLGCLGSLLISAAITLAALVLLGWISLPGGSW